MKIVLGCMLVTVLYGIVHDLITVHICLEYFTVFHPDLFHTTSPTLLALGWGVVATWWAGAMVGLVLACCAQWGAYPRIPLVHLRRGITVLLLVMACAACIAGVVGYELDLLPEDLTGVLEPAMRRRFLADWWSHSMSYASGFVGGIILAIVTLLKRRRVALRG